MYMYMYLLCVFYDCFAEILEALNYSSLTKTSASISTITSITVGEQFTKATTAYHALSISSVGQNSPKPSVPYTSSVSSMKHATTSANSGPQLPQGELCICMTCYTIPNA